MGVPLRQMKTENNNTQPHTYLVGGSVRDELLGIDGSDRDWVVVGCTADAMLQANYLPVGKDFPVFLHPQTHEEYALARVERKVGRGYHGFEFNTDASVTLEEDLSRRDLTINAIAKDSEGNLIDPYHGKQDIEKRVLRHISNAFIEDPVRVLRVARFMARFAHLGFTVAEETQALMTQMVHNGEVDNLVAERVWQEMDGALGARTPRAFFDTLQQCLALAVVLPEVAALYGIEQKAQYHPEIDSYIHTMMVLEQSCVLSSAVSVRFAALCHDLGKATTPKDILPSHYGHEERGARITETLCKRLRIPGSVRDLAVICARFHTDCHRVFELKPSTLVDKLRAIDVRRKPERFQQYLQVCEADARGRLGFENRDYPQAAYMQQASSEFCSVDAAEVAKRTRDKQLIAAEIRAAQIKHLKAWKRSA